MARRMTVGARVSANPVEIMGKEWTAQHFAEDSEDDFSDHGSDDARGAGAAEGA
jgi:hypothetical protein